MFPKYTNSKCFQFNSFPLFPALLASSISTHVCLAIHNTLWSGSQCGCETALLLKEEWWRLLAGCQISGMAIEKWKASSGGNCSSARHRPPTCRPLFQGAASRLPVPPRCKIQDARSKIRHSCVDDFDFEIHAIADDDDVDRRLSTIGDVIACSKRVSRIYFYNFFTLPRAKVLQEPQTRSLKAFVFAELLVAIFMAYWLSY